MKQTVCLLLLLPLLAAAETSRSFDHIVLADQPRYTADDGAIAREMASPRNSRLRTLSIADIVVPPGTTIEEHHHVDMEEVYLIVGGRGVMVVDGVQQVVGPGDAVVILPFERHYIDNPFEETLELNVYCSPPWAPEQLYFDPPPAALRIPPSDRIDVLHRHDLPWATQDEGIAYRMVAGPANSRLTKLEVGELRLAEGAVMFQDAADGIEWVYFVRAGEVTLQVGNDLQVVAVGETAVVLPGIGHRLANLSATPALMHRYRNH